MREEMFEGTLECQNLTKKYFANLLKMCISALSKGKEIN